MITIVEVATIICFGWCIARAISYYSIATTYYEYDVLLLLRTRSSY